MLAKATYNNKEVKIDIPESFIWVINYMNNWFLENKTGDIRLIYKEGGICGLETKEYIRPPEKNN